MAERWHETARSHWTPTWLTYPPVHEVFGGETSLRLVHYRSGWKSKILRCRSSEEYSHVISIKEPSWPGFRNAVGNDCCPVYVRHPCRSSGTDSEVGALRRILLLSAGRGCARPTSRGIVPVKQPHGSQPPRHWPQRYLRFQSLVW